MAPGRCPQLELADIQSCRLRCLSDWCFTERHEAAVFSQVGHVVVAPAAPLDLTSSPRSHAGAAGGLGPVLLFGHVHRTSQQHRLCLLSRSNGSAAPQQGILGSGPSHRCEIQVSVFGFTQQTLNCCCQRLFRLLLPSDWQELPGTCGRHHF